MPKYPYIDVFDDKDRQLRKYYWLLVFCAWFFSVFFAYFSLVGMMPRSIATTLIGGTFIIVYFARIMVIKAEELIATEKQMLKDFDNQKEQQLRELIRFLEEDKENAIGDPTCANNALSPYLRCAINPSGECSDCQHYAPSTDRFGRTSIDDSSHRQI